MSEQKKLAIVAVVLSLFAGLVWLLYGYSSGRIGSETESDRVIVPIQRPEKTTEQVLTERPDIAEVYRDDHVVGLDSEQFSGAYFDRFEGGRVYYLESGKSVSFPLTEEVVISCTLQSLSGATSYDINLVVNVKVYASGELSDGLISAGEAVVVTRTEVNGTETVYGVIVSSQACPF